MKRLLSWSGVLVLAAAVLLPASLQAQNYVFTNDNVPTTDLNTVSVFSVNPTTYALTPVSGSPFGTTGTGCLGVYYAANMIVTSPNGNFVYAVDAGSNDIAAFRVNKLTGALTLLGTVSTGGTDCSLGASLAITPTGNLLYVANSVSESITAFSVSAKGTLTPLPAAGIPSLGDSPDGIKVRPGGKFLAVALTISNAVGMYAIGPAGKLTAVPGSPFNVNVNGDSAGVDFKCGSKFLFDGEANPTETMVDEFSVAANGALSPSYGNLFTGPGVNSNVVLWDSFGQLLFVTNQNEFAAPGSGTVTDFVVSSTGHLTIGPNSPLGITGFLTLGPAGMAANTIYNPNTLATVNLLYVADPSNNVAVFTVGIDGTLTQVAYEATGASGQLTALAAWPAGVCK